MKPGIRKGMENLLAIVAWTNAGQDGSSIYILVTRRTASEQQNNHQQPDETIDEPAYAGR